MKREKIIQSNSWEEIRKAVEDVHSTYEVLKYLPVVLFAITVAFGVAYTIGLEKGIAMVIAGFIGGFIGRFIVGYIPGRIIGFILAKLYCSKVLIRFEDTFNKYNLDEKSFRSYINVLSGSLKINLDASTSGKYSTRGPFKQSYLDIDLTTIGTGLGLGTRSGIIVGGGAGKSRGKAEEKGCWRILCRL